MKGLLDFISTPEGQGLLAAGFGGLAGARRGQPINSLGRAGLAGLAGYSGAQDRIDQQEQNAVQKQFRDMQMQGMQAQMDAAKAAQAAADTKRNALPGLFAGQTVGGGTTTPEMGGIPMFSQGSTVEPTRTVGAGKLDVQAAFRAGYSPEEIVKMSELSNIGKQKVARTVKGMGPDGREVEYQVDEFGGRVGEGLAQYRAPIEVRQGDRSTFADPYSLKPVGSFAINQSPDSKASNAVAMRGQNMTDGRARERMAFDRAGGVAGTKPRQGPMSVTLQKELLESDDVLQSSQSVIRSLQAASAQNKKAYDGYFAKGRAQLVSNLGGSESADATIDIDNLMTGQGLDQMKAIFGAAPTEGERKILMDMQASVDKTPAQRQTIMDRAMVAAQRRADFAGRKAQAIRDGSYLTDGVSPGADVPPANKPVASSQDRQAMEWANANPNDPRAKEIKQRLGGR